LKHPFLAILVSHFLIAPCFAQAESPAEEKPEAVQVTGTRDPEFKTYRPFVAGLDVYEQRKSLAPLAHKGFILRTLDPAPNFDGVTMRIAGESESVAVPVAENGGFDMPRNEQMFKEDAEIILNRKKGTFRWRPHVVTPGLPENTRRLGDLRLECAARWAVERKEIVFVQRMAFVALGGPCETKFVNVLQLSPRPLAQVHLAAGERREELGKGAISQKGRAYVVPLHDSKWPDDTLIEFTFAENGQPIAN
jgi:hypothetical protein